MYRLILVAILAAFVGSNLRAQTSPQSDLIKVPVITLLTLSYQKYEAARWQESAFKVYGFSAGVNFIYGMIKHDFTVFQKGLVLDLAGVLLSYPLRYNNFELKGTTLTYRF